MTPFGDRTNVYSRPVINAQGECSSAPSELVIHFSIDETIYSTSIQCRYVQPAPLAPGKGLSATEVQRQKQATAAAAKADLAHSSESDFQPGAAPFSTQATKVRVAGRARGSSAPMIIPSRRERLAPPHTAKNVRKPSRANGSRSGFRRGDVEWGLLPIVGRAGKEEKLPRSVNGVQVQLLPSAPICLLISSIQPSPVRCFDPFEYGLRNHLLVCRVAPAPPSLADKALFHVVCVRDDSLVYAGRCRWLKYEEEVVLVQPQDEGILAAIREAGGEGVGSSIHWYHVLYKDYGTAVAATLVEAYRRRKAVARGSKTTNKRKRADEEERKKKQEERKRQQEERKKEQEERKRQKEVNKALNRYLGRGYRGGA
ncbi:hypothetical protein C8R46DRAFT_1268626 [Mycena filopes]|nr:hypothetical protein C8R46DRAFT_1268626 [Mycena filopes]